MSFQDIFGGDTLYPADLSYRAITLSASVTLQWPTEASAQTNLVAAIMDVTATAGSLVITMPPATEVSTGTAVVFNNVGGTTFTVNDNGGTLLLTVASGTIWTAYVTSNSTVAGTWKTYQNGVGTSSASAASLAGYGIKAITTTLNQSMPVTTTAVDFTADATYRAGVWVWTGGAGIASLTSPVTLGNDWFTNIKNSGTGNLVLTPLSGTIDGSTTVTLGPDESAIVVSDGTNFYTIGLTPIPTPGFDYISIAVPGTGNYTLAGTELGRISYAFTGILTGDRTIIVPATVQQYWVSNDTTGAYNFYVKTSAQTSPGVRVLPGMSRLLRCDGTNVVDAASNPYVPQVPSGTGVNTIVVTIPTAQTQYTQGFPVDFVAVNTNTGAVTVNVNSLGAVALRKNGAALTANAILPGQAVRAIYVATIPSFEMVDTTYAPDGSLSAPSIAFNGDRDTGRYLSGANQMVDVVSGQATTIFHAAGYQTYPLQTAFLASKTTDSTNQTGTGGSATVIFDSAILNTGSGYNTTSGIFTAPVTGKYRLSANVELTLLSSVAQNTQINLVTSNRTYISRPGVTPTSTAFNQDVQITTLADMDVGDTAVIQVASQNMAGPTVTVKGNASVPVTYFSGELVA